MNQSPSLKSSHISRSRRIGFRLGAIVFGLGLLVICELTLRLFGLGIPKDAGDPFVGFSDIHPLFVQNEVKGRFEVSETRYDFFRPDSFAIEKGENEFRIFCLGGSTVQGRPYAIETSFTTWLELTLKAADSNRNWQVVNCGGVSYASYRLVPILQEVLQYEPDLLIVYTGHNEFLEDRTYSQIKEKAGWLRNVQARATRLRIFGILQSAAGSFHANEQDTSDEQNPKDILGAEVDALLDYKGGLEKYHRDDERKRGVVAHFEHNLRRMIAIANRAQVPIMLANPVSNLRDSPPFKCENKELGPEQQREFDRRWNEAKQIAWKQIDAKIEAVKQVLEIDDRFANAYFLLARCLEEKRQFDEAKAAYIRAKDEDICPLRILESMNQIVRQVAQSTGTPLVDVQALIEQDSPHGITGNSWLVDHVHPNIEGHQRIAIAFFKLMAEQQIVVAKEGWQAKRKRHFDNHMQTLAPTYFPMSVERLNGLKRWAAGRVERIKAESD